jgi:hypothetical protein
MDALQLIFILIAASGVVGGAPPDHGIGNLNNHSKPYNTEELEHQEHGQKYPFDLSVQADCTLLVEDRFDVPPCTKPVWVCRLQCCPGVTSIAHHEGHIPVNGPTKGDKDSVARDEPSREEQYKHSVAG